ncbi:hypothetical protein HOD08_00240 [bacterium]|jgi:hypothetical protein|nr:hypothetical protein [bacterium]
MKKLKVIMIFSIFATATCVAIGPQVDTEYHGEYKTRTEQQPQQYKYQSKYPPQQQVQYAPPQYAQPQYAPPPQYYAPQYYAPQPQYYAPPQYAPQPQYSYWNPPPQPRRYGAAPPQQQRRQTEQPPLKRQPTTKSQKNEGQKDLLPKDGGRTGASDSPRVVEHSEVQGSVSPSGKRTQTLTQQLASIQHSAENKENFSESMDDLIYLLKSTDLANNATKKERMEVGDTIAQIRNNIRWGTFRRGWSDQKFFTKFYELMNAVVTNEGLIALLNKKHRGQFLEYFVDASYKKLGTNTASDEAIRVLHNTRKSIKKAKTYVEGVRNMREAVGKGNFIPARSLSAFLMDVIQEAKEKLFWSGLNLGNDWRKNHFYMEFGALMGTIGTNTQVLDNIKALGHSFENRYSKYHQGIIKRGFAASSPAVLVALRLYNKIRDGIEKEGSYSDSTELLAKAVSVNFEGANDKVVSAFGKLIQTAKEKLHWSGINIRFDWKHPAFYKSLGTVVASAKGNKSFYERNRSLQKMIDKYYDMATEKIGSAPQRLVRKSQKRSREESVEQSRSMSR